MCKYSKMFTNKKFDRLSGSQGKYRVRTQAHARAYKQYANYLLCVLCSVRTHVCTNVRTFFVLTNFKKNLLQKKILIKSLGFYENT